MIYTAKDPVIVLICYIINKNVTKLNLLLLVCSPRTYIFLYVFILNYTVLFYADK